MNFINSKKIFEDRLIYRFKQIVSEHSGLNIRKQDNEKLSEAVSLRMKSLRLSSPDAYYQILETGSKKSKAEFRELTICLTTGETYFFRDKGQFSLLKFSILPELIELRKDKRALRIWSAGCSTGEEAYSIAILIRELLQNQLNPKSAIQIPNFNDWDILILGTDINEDALKKARSGYYRDWSFRMVSEDIKKKWFRKFKEGWRLNKDIIEMVKFESVDLINDDYSDYKSILHDMDIILCRNVFIYFIPEVVSRVISKLSEILNDGGYLMTGHAELPQQAIANLRPRIFPESVVYRKIIELGVGSEESKLTLPLISSHQGRGDIYTPSPLAGEGRGEGVVMSEAKEFFKQGNYLLTIEKLGHILQVNSRNFDAHYLMSKTYANMGEHDKSIYHCQQAIEIDKFNAEPYYLLAQIFREKGGLEKEEEMLKKVIYLEPSHIAAYLEMGIIYEGKGDRDRAFKMRNTALNLLKALPSDARIEPYTEMTAEELIRRVQEMVR